MSAETFEPMRMKRLLFYSHDTVGLGHIRRTQKIANQLSDPNTSILIICSSPKASEFESAEGIEYLKLPSFTKLQDGSYIPKNLKMSLSEFIELRSELILATVKSFKPDVFLVDKEPLGVGGELKSALSHIKNHLEGCITICGLRDILDDPESLATEWRKRGSAEALEEYYRSILVYGDQKIYDLGNQHQMNDSIQRKMKYVGYLLQPESLIAEKPKEDTWPSFEDSDKPFVLFTLGGGEDGAEYLHQIADSLHRLSENDLNAVVVTGPFLPNSDYAAFYAKVYQLGNVRCMKFSSNMKELITKANLIVSMGGYNTFCEIVSMGKRPLILPRVRPRKEQLIRAQIFNNLGVCDYIDPDVLSGEVLSNRIIELLSERRQPMTHFNVNGLENTRGHIQEYLLADSFR